MPGITYTGKIGFDNTCEYKHPEVTGNLNNHKVISKLTTPCLQTKQVPPRADAARLSAVE